MKKIFYFILCMSLFGCSQLERNTGNMAKFLIPDVEAEWIQNGEPILFEGVKWYPQDRFDVFLDAEVYLKGEYEGAQFFVQKIDIRPYAKIFTKFGRNKFRIFLPREEK